MVIFVEIKNSVVLKYRVARAAGAKAFAYLKSKNRRCHRRIGGFFRGRSNVFI